MYIDCVDGLHCAHTLQASSACHSPVHSGQHSHWFAGEPQLMLTAGPAAMGMGVVPPVQPGYAAAPGFGAMPAGPMPPAGMPAGMPAYGYSM